MRGGWCESSDRALPHPPRGRRGNQQLIADIFHELNSTDPGGLRNAAFRYGDESRSLHIAQLDEGSTTRADSAAFARFAKSHGDRVTAAPTRDGATVIGSYPRWMNI